MNLQRLDTIVNGAVMSLVDDADAVIGFPTIVLYIQQSVQHTEKVLLGSSAPGLSM